MYAVRTDAVALIEYSVSNSNEVDQIVCALRDSRIRYIAAEILEGLFRIILLKNISRTFIADEAVKHFHVKLCANRHTLDYHIF